MAVAVLVGRVPADRLEALALGLDAFTLRNVENGAEETERVAFAIARHFKPAIEKYRAQ